MTPKQREAAERLAPVLADIANTRTPSAAGFAVAEAAALLRELAAAPMQEPAIWIQSNHLQHAKNGPYLARTGPTKLMSDFIPLYAAPQQRKPLSADQIRDAVNDHAFWATSKNFIFRIARAIERAHGITGEPT